MIHLPVSTPDRSIVGAGAGYRDEATADSRKLVPFSLEIITLDYLFFLQGIGGSFYRERWKEIFIFIKLFLIKMICAKR